MPNCHHCGREVGNKDERCDYCGSYLASPGAYPPRPTREHTDYAQQSYVDEFTWAPGCCWYTFSRAMLPFFWLILLVRLITIGLGFYRQNIVLWGGNPAHDLGFVISWSVLIVVELAVVISAGRWGRRRRWEQLTWAGFDQFRRNENAWTLAGIFGWLFSVILFIMGFLLDPNLIR